MHPMKGPMTTQTLKGSKNLDPFHWRGDRSGFNAFNPAFSTLLGGAQLSAADMDAFREFVETMSRPIQISSSTGRCRRPSPVAARARDGIPS